MKRTPAIILVVTLLLTALFISGCGQGGQNAGDKDVSIKITANTVCPHTIFRP